MEQLNEIIMIDKTKDNIINNTNDKIENFTITFDNTQDKIILECVKKIHNPFINISVKDVAKDLQIGENMAYEIFRRDDFPSINIGRKWKITLIAYLLWKTQKRV